MTATVHEDSERGGARSKLERAGRLQYIHWVVIFLSFCLTFFAWRYASVAQETLNEQRFDREVEQVVALVMDRMQKYEDVLWAGTAVIHSYGGDIDFDRWEDFASSLEIETKYPGINGIGVIHDVDGDELDAYLAHQRELRPTYYIHPEHGGGAYLPISYIIPVEGNEKAVGLDMAHEQNRLAAAIKARDTGLAQITGPITLVQDAQKTPGFLFYAPFYADGELKLTSDRAAVFRGMVYAPFVVNRLMEGVLSKNFRYVGVRISDGDEVLYDENKPGEEFYDSSPLFARIRTLEFYGREWILDFRSASSFREAYSTSQSLSILIGGILINVMLIGLFSSLTRSARNTLHYADIMTARLDRRTRDLEHTNLELGRSNQELDDFARVASHDLKEPLRGIRNYASFLLEDYEDKLDEEGKAKLHTLGKLSERLTTFINDLLEMSRVGRIELQRKSCKSAQIVDDVLSTLAPWLEDENVTVQVSKDMPVVKCHAVMIDQVFRNLIANGVKYNASVEKRIKIDWRKDRDMGIVFSVEDNGIGIPERHADNVFTVFKRLHGRDEYGGGTGAGLSIAKKIVERHGGSIWLESEEGSGSTFYFALGNTEEVSNDSN